ncbi:glycosyltransferase [Exiguobacterium sp. SH3S2]|uniref:bifunctional glycosyltransferase/CDP-glycerol:glycerophosphate glycerophosphotransferase n=1 Tax=unclassified Exiguobacterium TaxID=2644629 RepID=UPI0010390072|nr:MULTISPECIES: bifunctional glycosyltransferase family 2 protein/CDP-glycerol:glycerophosphate glycerophosphotransferase [unclassified Exiguobacterium]TCI46132.1 glycosyltransferase [Exiguobacterium sp. SH3S3]TCI61220.1 glycosyltransferase [Exiguobacterium sp. SH3S2]
MNSISVVIPLLSHHLKYQRAIRSVLDQEQTGHLDVKIVLIAHDKHLDIISLDEFPSVKIITVADELTVYKAIRHCAQQVDTDYVTYLDADDILAPRAIFTWYRAERISQQPVIVGQRRQIYNKKSWIQPIDHADYFLSTNKSFSARMHNSIKGWCIHTELLKSLPSLEVEWFGEVAVAFHVFEQTSLYTKVNYVVYGNNDYLSGRDQPNLYAKRDESTLLEASHLFNYLYFKAVDEDSRIQISIWFESFIVNRGRKYLEMIEDSHKRKEAFEMIAKDLKRISLRKNYAKVWSANNHSLFQIYKTGIQLKSILKIIAKAIKRKPRKASLYPLLCKLPVKKNLVLFESFLGRSYSDNPKAIYQRLIKKRPDMDAVWIFSSPPSSEIAEQCPNWVLKNSMRYFYYMARAEYWVFNTRQPLSLFKPEHTTYLQTWHGTPLKKLGLDMDEVHMAGTNTARYKRNFYKQAQQWDYLISPNHYSSAIFRSAFGFSNQLLEVGYPRNDVLYNANDDHQIKLLKEELNLPKNKKIILYAPTWRDDEFIKKGNYRFDLKLELSRMQKALGEEYIVLLRMHYLISENIDTKQYEGFVYDFSNYHDISDLYLISDLLITDYSSVFFDYAHLNRPIIFFAYDLEKYASTLRGFYFNFEEIVPGPLYTNTNEIVDYIKNIDTLEKTYENRIELFNQTFCHLDNGEAAEKVIDTVFK